MKMNLITFISILNIAVNASGQQSRKGMDKPPIDTSSFRTWPSTDFADVSNDGQYMYYCIKDNYLIHSSVVIRGIVKKWEVNIDNIDRLEFTDDSRQAVFRFTDSIGVLTLGSDAVKYFGPVKSFRLIHRNRSDLLACLSKDQTLKLVDLTTWKVEDFDKILDYVITPDGYGLLLKSELNKGGKVLQSIEWVNLLNNTKVGVWEGYNADNLILDSDSRKLAFKVIESESNKTASIWYYYLGEKTAIKLTDDALETESALRLDRISKFSKNGARLFVLLKENEAPKPGPNAVMVNIWSYSDAKIQSQQLRELRSNYFLGVIDIKGRRIIRLQHEDERIAVQEDDWIVVIHNKGEFYDNYWSSSSKNTVFLVSTINGVKEELKVPLQNLQISPGKKYIIGINEAREDCYSFEIATGKISNITKLISVPISENYDEPLLSRNRGFRFAAWASGDDALIYDDYDVWRVDPSGEKRPICITNKYGRKRGVIFRLLEEGSKRPVRNDSDLIFIAFDKNKSGFFRGRGNDERNPVLLSMGPYLYFFPGEGVGTPPVKARDVDMYLVQRQSYKAAPNYFWTKDFIDFHELSNVYPEKNYNWMSCELLSFKTLAGRTEKGILYKPENFDPQKRYPVIISYYERESRLINKYHAPVDLTGGELDIAWFVSHGYIVCKPDIHYIIGKVGESAYNSIMGVAKYISEFKWIDSKHMGLHGHSFGGYETNYVVTQTNLFAAAVSSCGLTDIVSEYGTTLRGGNQSYIENMQLRMGATLWERPDLYIKNSPIFYAHRIKTPLVIVANQADKNVSYSQGIEWFLGLRRLGKKIWMLQYDGGDHGVSGNDYTDYIIRTNQFFDYYLRHSKAPVWMIEGVPAKMKGLKTGYELDSLGRSLDPGLLLKKGGVNRNK